MKLGAQLPDDLKRRLIKLLERNADLFAWVPANMSGIDPGFMCHRLAIKRTSKPIAHKEKKKKKKGE